MANLDKFVIGEMHGVKELGYGKYNDASPNAFELLDLIYGNVPAYSDEGIKLFKRFCVDHGIYYYSAPHENFCAPLAFDEAANAGATYVLMDDLS